MQIWEFYTGKKTAGQSNLHAATAAAKENMKDKRIINTLIIFAGGLIAYVILFTLLNPRDYQEASFVEWCEVQNLDTSDYTDGEYEYQYQVYLIETNK